jgi:Family of unknown function (DUF6171)
MEPTTTTVCTVACSRQPLSLQKAMAEIATVSCTRILQTLRAQVNAGLQALEAVGCLPAARNPAEFGAHLVGYWQKCGGCLCPITEMQEQVGTFVTALGRHIAGAMQTVSNDVYQRRLATCRNCDFFLDNTCLKCGCRLAGDVIAKARWPREKCPLGRWLE